jgi:hypothetical protein
MSRTAHPTLGGELLATLTQALATAQQLMSDPEPSVALRGVAEFTKLLGACARAKLIPNEDDDPPAPGSTPVVPENVPAEPTPAKEPPSLKAKPESLIEDIVTERWSESKFYHHLPHLDPDGPRLKSFLGKPATVQKPPERGKSV